MAYKYTTREEVQIEIENAIGVLGLLGTISGAHENMVEAAHVRLSCEWFGKCGTSYRDMANTHGRTFDGEDLAKVVDFVRRTQRQRNKHTVSMVLINS